MSTFDFTGAEQFFRLSGLLQEGGEPSPSAWRALFDTPGYRALTAGEFQPHFLKDVWRLALSPRLASERQKMEGQAGRMARHARKAVSRKEELLEFRDLLVSRQEDLLQQARQKALRYLPEGQFEDWSEVAFLVFDSDARGYVPLAVDLMFALDLGNPCRLASLLAHEYHHQQVFGLRGLAPGGPDKRHDIVWILDQIHLEGIADMITVPEMEEADRNRFAARVERAPEYLARLDRGIREAASNPDRADQWGRRLREDLPESGHPIGYFMARIISRHLGHEALVQAATHPLRFLRAFSRACRKGGHEAPLSDEAILEAARVFYRQAE